MNENPAISQKATDTNTTAPGEEEESWGSFLVFCLKLVLAVLLFRTLIASFFTIPSESMLPGLRTGDYLIAAKWPYGYNENSLPLGLPGPSERVLGGLPERGDVVIFKHPIDRTDYVKRAIGLPGDTIAIQNGQLILNGEPVQREEAGFADIPMSANTACRADGGRVLDNLCRYRQFRETLPSGKSYMTLDFGSVGARPLRDASGNLLMDESGRPVLIDPDNTEPFVVPDGKIFVMGDNRDNSLDSRYPAVGGQGVGVIDQELLVGRASFVLWSTDGSAEWLLPWTWFTAARWDRIGEGI